MLFRRNVFILGAGFTADAGAPLMRNFLQTAKLLQENPRSGMPELHRQIFGNVFGFLRDLRIAQAKFNLDLENIEHLFSLAEMQIQFGASPQGEFRQELISLICQTLERSMQRPQTRGGSVAIRTPTGNLWTGLTSPRGGSTYGDLFAAFTSRRWLAGEFAAPADGPCQDTIITMNYDCFVDDALLAINVQPDYHLGSATYEAGFRAGRFRLIDVLKLHGSMNWFVCAETSCDRRIQVWNSDPDRRLSYSYKDTRSELCGHLVEPLIVPPTWAKAIHRDALDSVWRQALEALRQAGRIFIIGYSMPDTDVFFKYMLSLALATNERVEEIICVNPDGDALTKYQELFNQYFRDRRLILMQQTAQDFVMGALGDHLGQNQEGLSVELIRESGFGV